MTTDPKAALLGTLELFSDCSTRELHRIAALFDEVEVAPGTVLTTEGEAADQAFVVAGGQADLTLREHRLGRIGRGELIGEMGLLDRSMPRSATVTARTPMHLLVLDPRSFSQLLERHPRVTLRLARMIARRLTTTERALVAA